MAEQPAERTGLAAQLRLLRRRAGLSQEGLAEKAGVGVTTIAAIEEGQRRRPHPHTVRALADALELSAAERDALVSPAAPPESRVSSAPAGAPESGLAEGRLSTAVPRPLSALIGRERELSEARALLDGAASSPGARLLTLLGPGGVGKTRLALELTRALSVAYADGAAFVDLAPIREARLVPTTIARALGLHDSGGRPARDLLLAHLQPRRMLLVLDNFEHLLSAASLLSELLAACPGLALLVTSRTALRLRDEQRMPIGPLATPSASSSLPELAEVAEYPAVRLFVDRVRHVNPEFSLDASNVAAVGAICRRLDGIPLALELAAARTQVLAPGALLARLDRALHLLSSGPVDLPERQRTLRNTLAWSYDLLEPPERELFGRLAVFAGGWNLDAALTVCADDADPDDNAVLHSLGKLIDSSLVRRLEGAADEPRFGMHEVVREYALERLQGTSEEPRLRARHLAHYLGHALTAEDALDGADQRAWLDRLERDHDNVRAALEWSAQSPGAAADGLRMATALLFFWFLHGHLREGRARVETALAAANDLAEPWLRGRGLAALGHLLFALGQFGEARVRLEAGLALARAARDALGAAFALRYLGLLTSIAGDHETAGALLEESLANARQVDASMDVAMVLAYLGDHALRRNDVARARELFEESATVLRQMCNHMVLAYPLRRLGLLAFQRGDLQLAIELCIESVGRNRDGGERLSVAAALVTLAPIAAHQGHLTRAVHLLSKAEQLAASIGGQMLPFEAEQFDAAVAHTRQHLPPEVWSAAWSEGRDLSLDGLLIEIQSLPRPVASPHSSALS